MRSNRFNQTQQGFTLIEIMIAVAIIGILAAIAVPQYQQYVMSSRITTATTGLSEMRLKMEQYFQDNRTYAGDGACAEPGSATVAPRPADTQFFKFECTDPRDQRNYKVTATGLSTMDGFVFTLEMRNNQLIRTTTAVPTAKGWSLPNPNNCWARNKSGNC